MALKTGSLNCLACVLEKQPCLAVGEGVGATYVWPVQTSCSREMRWDWRICTARSDAGSGGGSCSVLATNQIPLLVSPCSCGTAPPSRAVTSTESCKFVKQKRRAPKCQAPGWCLVLHSFNFLRITWGCQEMDPCPYLVTGLPFTHILLLPGITRVVAMVRTVRFLSSSEAVLGQWCFAIRGAQQSLVGLTPRHSVPETHVHPGPRLCRRAACGRATDTTRGLSGPRIVATTVSFLCRDLRRQLFQQGHKPKQSWSLGCHCPWHPSLTSSSLLWGEGWVLPHGNSVSNHHF